MTYILSNIKCSRPIPDLDQDNDELVFLNMAAPWEMYKNCPCLKYLYCRANDKGGYFVRPEWKGKELQYFNDFKVLRNDWSFNYPNGLTPTTGFWVWSVLKEAKEVTLVNFFPNQDFTTTHWEGHNWKYEQETLEKEHPRILDLR